jgi:hypothetical protein
VAKGIGPEFKPQFKKTRTKVIILIGPVWKIPGKILTSQSIMKNENALEYLDVNTLAKGRYYS